MLLILHTSQRLYTIYPLLKTHRPVVVEVAEFVGEPLHVVWFEATGVVDDVEVGWGDSSLTHTLTHQEKIIPTHSTDEGGGGKRDEEYEWSQPVCIIIVHRKGLQCDNIVHNCCLSFSLQSLAGKKCMCKQANLNGGLMQVGKANMSCGCESHHSGLVITVSAMVPGGGLASWPLASANIRLLILFFTTNTLNLGLKRIGG